MVASIDGTRHHEQLLPDQALPSFGIRMCGGRLKRPHHNILEHAHSDSGPGRGLSEGARQHFSGYKSVSVIDGIVLVVAILGIAILPCMILAGKICPHIAGVHTLYNLICIVHFLIIYLLCLTF